MSHARLFRKNEDGSWTVAGTVIEVTWSRVGPDGEDVPPPGTCPECRRQPFDETPIICPHGVTLRGGRA